MVHVKKVKLAPFEKKVSFAFDKAQKMPMIRKVKNRSGISPVSHSPLQYLFYLY